LSRTIAAASAGIVDRPARGLTINASSCPSRGLAIACIIACIPAAIEGKDRSCCCKQQEQDDHYNQQFLHFNSFPFFFFMKDRFNFVNLS
jgi:hypothetical protein